MAWGCSRPLPAACAAVCKGVKRGTGAGQWPAPGLIPVLQAAGLFWEPMAEFSTQPPLVMNARPFSVKSTNPRTPSRSSSTRLASFLSG